jgi:DNA-binding transcriptional LysR family regulator
MSGEIISGDAEAFTTFGEFLNFTRAAEQLHISQPALHVKIRKLAQTLGCELYERHGNSLSLTTEGAALARLVEDLLRQREDFLARLRGAPPNPIVLAAGEGAY